MYRDRVRRFTLCKNLVSGWERVKLLENSVESRCSIAEIGSMQAEGTIISWNLENARSNLPRSGEVIETARTMRTNGILISPLRKHRKFRALRTSYYLPPTYRFYTLLNGCFALSTISLEKSID